MMQEKMITALHIISSMRRGGRERQLAIIVKYSSRLDNKIVYYNSSDCGYIDQYGLEGKSIYSKERGFWKRVANTIKLTNETKASVIVSWGNMESLIAMCVSFFTGIPFVNFSIRHGIRRRVWSQYFRTIVLHLSQIVVANSLAGLKANNVRKGMVLYNGIENIERTIDNRERDSNRGKLYPGMNGSILISVANLVPYKDYMTVLTALKLIDDMGIDFTYLIVGEGPNRSSIEDQIATIGLHAKVKLLGRVVDVDKYYRISDIMIHSSKGEGCSNAILEAMKHGLPIVATNVGGTPEIVNDKCGILFEYQDEKALTEALLKLIHNPVLRYQMGMSAHEAVKNRFSVEAMIEGYESIVMGIVDESKRANGVV